MAEGNEVNWVEVVMAEGEVLDSDKTEQVAVDDEFQNRMNSTEPRVYLYMHQWEQSGQKNTEMSKSVEKGPASVDASFLKAKSWPFSSDGKRFLFSQL